MILGKKYYFYGLIDLIEQVDYRSGKVKKI